MDFNSEAIEAYILSHSQKEPALLRELNRETHHKILQPRMLSGHFQGRLLSMISKLIRPTTVLEIGTYTGYSALCLAEGLAADGKIHTIDVNEELVDFQRKFFEKSPYNYHIQQYTGDAAQIIPTLKLNFDLIFIDADKPNYPVYFNLIIDKLNPGGVLLSDNVLWSGKVVEPLQDKDESTKAVLAYNKLLAEDERLETIILPIRDGLSISRRK